MSGARPGTDIEQLPPGDVRRRLNEAPLTRSRRWALFVVACLFVIDGLDLYSIGIAAPALERDAAMGITKAQLGSVFAAGLVGMAFGSLLLSPIADYVGKRPLVLGSLLLMTAGTAWTTFATGLFDLLGSRVVAGLGIGALIPVANALSSEYSNEKRRNFFMSILSLGIPIGIVLGGLIGSQTLPVYGWRSIFVIATLMSTVLLVVAMVGLPEPVSGLLARPRADTLDRINLHLARCDIAPLSTLPEALAKTKPSPMALFRADHLGITVMVSAVYMLFAISTYYAGQWLPSLVAAAGSTPAQSTVVSVIYGISGIVGGLLLSLLLTRFGLRTALALVFTLTVGGTIAFGYAPADLRILTAFAGILGFAAASGFALMNPFIARNFPAEARSTGIGFALGVGRFASAVGPAWAGWLFSQGHDRPDVSLVLAMPAAAALGLLLVGRFRSYA